MTDTTKHAEAFNRYKATYAYGELVKKHSLDSVRIWDIYGEDPNCDLGGHHHEPFLEQVEGRLEDVIFYAVGLPRFWNWGGGGRIAPALSQEIKPIPSYADEIKKATQAEAEKSSVKEDLKRQIAALQKKLRNL